MSRYRVCALGTSHLAAAKLGWERIKDDHPDYGFTFFAFPPGTSTELDQHVAIRDGRLVATSDKLREGFALTSGGLTEIRGADYDAFVTFGLGVVGPTHARSIYSNHRTEEFVNPGSRLMSRALVEAYVRDVCSTRAALEPFELLRAITGAPIFLQSVLTPMTDILTAEKFSGNAHCIPNIYRHLRPIFDRICADVGQPDRYHYVEQPEETQDESGLTKPEYVRSGVGFGGFTGQTKTNDYGHGNVDYGVLVMRGLLDAFEQVGLRARATA